GPCGPRVAHDCRARARAAAAGVVDGAAGYAARRAAGGEVDGLTSDGSRGDGGAGARQAAASGAGGSGRTVGATTAGGRTAGVSCTTQAAHAPRSSSAWMWCPADAAWKP